MWRNETHGCIGTNIWRTMFHSWTKPPVSNQNSSLVRREIQTRYLSTIITICLKRNSFKLSHVRKLFTCILICPASYKLIGNETSDSFRVISFPREFLSLISQCIAFHSYLWRKWLFWLLIIAGMMSTGILLRVDTVHVLRTVRHCIIRRELLWRKTARIWHKIHHSTFDWSIKWRVPVFIVTIISDRLSKRIFKPLNIRHTFDQSSEDVDSSSFTCRVKSCTRKLT